MKIDVQTFNSPFARRLFFFLFLLVTIPVMVLASITIVQVTDYLSNQHRQQLQSEAKNIALNLYQRLNRVAVELPQAASQAGVSAGNAQTEAPQYRLISVQPHGRQDWLFQEPLDPALADRAIRAERPLAPGQWVIRSLDTANGRAFLALYKAGAEALLIARLQPEYLWGPDHLPLDKTACLIEGDHTVLFCSESAPNDLLSGFVEAHTQSSSGQFDWKVDGESRLVVYWGAVLDNIGMDSEWSVLLSESEQQFSAPIERFQNSLIVIMLVSVLAAILIGVGQIRRVLKPLEALRMATSLVGDGKLDNSVEIHSGDEFEELADAFNTMTGKLQWQFQQLEALAVIDRLILSSMDSQCAVNQVVDHVQAFLGCELLALCIEQDGYPQLQVSLLGEIQKRAATIIEDSTYRLALSDITDQTEVVREQQPAWLPQLPQVPPLESWSSIPLLIGGQLKGLAIVGSSQSNAQARSLLPSALQAIGRISIAVTRAGWQSQLYQQAHFDELTGLPNRLALKERLNQALERSQRYGTRLAVLFLDLDRFKLINDSIGHSAGDCYLQVIAKRIQGCVRDSDMVARLGGDEFTIALPDLSDAVDPSPEVMMVIDRLLSRIPQPVRIGSHELRSTLSIGIAVFPDDGQTLEDLMKQADTAMYQSKQRGGDSYHFYTQDMHDAARQRLELESDMRQALELDQFELYFQPQVAASNGEIVGAEVLLRWRHPQRGMVPPGVFIPIAEESLLIADIDRWVLHAACRQIRSWLDAGLEPVSLAINISAAQFQQRDFLQLVDSTLATFELGAERVELEITEGALINHMSHALETLRQLSESGISLAIDDFGTGYCSLSYLKTMPINKLKIDQSFIRDITRSARDAAIVEVILQLSQQLGLSSVAEGVESADERDWLQAKGCEVFQGYLFYRPLPAEEFSTLLAQRAVETVALSPAVL